MHPHHSVPHPINFTNRSTLESDLSYTTSSIQSLSRRQLFQMFSFFKAPSPSSQPTDLTILESASNVKVDPKLQAIREKIATQLKRFAGSAKVEAVKALRNAWKRDSKLLSWARVEEVGRKDTERFRDKIDKFYQPPVEFEMMVNIA